MSAELLAHLEVRYRVGITSVRLLDRDVHEVHLADGRTWVARWFHRRRSVVRAEGDAAVLRHLEALAVPAERLAHADPVSELEGRAVLVTHFVHGQRAGGSAQALWAVGELLGRIHTLPTGSGLVTREAGSLHHDPDHEGGPAEDLASARDYLAALRPGATGPYRKRLDELWARLDGADPCADLPRAFVHPDPALVNVRELPGTGPVLIDWTGAGCGPRIVSLAALLFTAPMATGGWDLANIDHVVAGYRTRIRPEPEELGRLADALRIRPMWLAAFQAHVAVKGGATPLGTEWWWPDHDVIDAVAARARAAFA